MKKIVVVALMIMSVVLGRTQQVYWVFLSDKDGVAFNPYEYFDSHAIERYKECGADLYDVTNYPLRADYVTTVDGMVTEVVGCSRWLNAIGVEATSDQIALVDALPFVARVQAIVGNATLANVESDVVDDLLDNLEGAVDEDEKLEDQLLRMHGNLFRERGIDGSGVRIAVFDGGFPRVNTHKAFKHLRDNNRILATWNFPKKKEDVYGWNSHGTMTLSCIAGKAGKSVLGLATGAEFLLARTEVNSEPYKEEIWWMQAVEWADKHGANIISSSLGYGKERHYTTDMDGTSYVARAGNLAARKGMLVCNSAGNEGLDRRWKTIITPSDADSVLCVGGTAASLTTYSRISFSSFGPSADGRLKPNVSAYGHAKTANVTNDSAVHFVDGTSFSCPLVAGFAACAKQCMPHLSAMQLFAAIEQSADRYPYYDYSLGYGVPQADVFVGIQPEPQQLFTLSEDSDFVYVNFVKHVNKKALFYHYALPDGTLDNYGEVIIDDSDVAQPLCFDKAAIKNHTLRVCVDRQVDSYNLSRDDSARIVWYPRMYQPFNVSDVAQLKEHKNIASIRNVSKWGDNSRWSYDIFYQYAAVLGVASDVKNLTYSDLSRYGVRVLRALSKSYRLGIGIERSVSHLNFNTSAVSQIDAELFPTMTTADLVGLKKQTLRLGEWNVEVFQRVRLVPGGAISGRGWYFDLGVYGGISTNRYKMTWQRNEQADGMREERNQYRGLSMLDDQRLNWGASLRFGYGLFAVQLRYRLTDVFDNNKPAIDLPRLEVGAQVAF